MNPAGPREFDGAFYAAIGDFVREKYLDWGFTRGTTAEVDFLLQVMKLPAGARILDIGCGTGRHSLELARRGFRMTGVDLSTGLIEVARAKARSENLPADFIVQDARQLQVNGAFDAAICLCEGAFGLMGSDEAHQQMLQRVAGALRINAPFVLTAINAYAAVREKCGVNYDVYTCTKHYRETIHSPDGNQREVDIFTTAFTFRELKLMLEHAGFVVDAGYGVKAGDFAARPVTVDATE